MKSWGPATFTVGDSVANLPMAVFKAIGPLTIKFNLNSNQRTYPLYRPYSCQLDVSTISVGARTLEIATTNAFAGGRPQVKVNNWTGPAPAAPNQPNSRGVTRGTWRGNVRPIRLCPCDHVSHPKSVDAYADCIRLRFQNIQYTINIREHPSPSHSAEIRLSRQY